MVDTHIQFKTYLKNQGHSLTLPRKMVFTAMSNRGPVTMGELIKLCGQEIDRASIYRVVALFEQLHIIQRLQIGWKYRLELSDTFQHHHHHLFCIKCNSVIALPEDQLLEKQLQSLAKQKGFETQDHQIEIRGICLDCKNKNSLEPLGTR